MVPQSLLGMTQWYTIFLNMITPSDRLLTWWYNIKSAIITHHDFGGMATPLFRYSPDRISDWLLMHAMASRAIWLGTMVYHSSNHCRVLSSTQAKNQTHGMTINVSKVHRKYLLQKCHRCLKQILCSAFVTTIDIWWLRNGRFQVMCHMSQSKVQQQNAAVVLMQKHATTNKLSND